MNRNKYTGKISRYILAMLILGGLTLTSCTKDDNDIFEDDPVVRIDKMKKEIKDKLVDSENGWIVSFSPDGEKYLGEFSLWYQFNEDGTVLQKSDLNLDDVNVEVGEYNFVLLKTVALNFATGGKIHDFTAMSPSDLRTDIEFNFVKYVDDNTIEFEGHMTKQKVYFKKATTEEKKFQFTKRWDLVAKLRNLTSASLVVNGKTSAIKYTHLWEENNFRAGMLDKLGVIHYKATDDGKTVELLKPIEVAENDFISELILTGTSFVGKSASGATLTLK